MEFHRESHWNHLWKAPRFVETKVGGVVAAVGARKSGALLASERKQETNKENNYIILYPFLSDLCPSLLPSWRWFLLRKCTLIGDSRAVFCWTWAVFEGQNQRLRRGVQHYINPSWVCLPDFKLMFIMAVYVHIYFICTYMYIYVLEHI